jgi:hypothetical protein
MLDNGYPPFFTPLTMELLTDLPEYVSPTTPTIFPIGIYEGNDTLVAGSAQIHYRFSPGGAWQTSPMTQVAGEMYEATMPPPGCDGRPEFYFSAEGVATGPVYLPSGAPSAVYTAFVGEVIIILNDDFESDQGWTVENVSLTDGAWQRGVPADDGTAGDPTTDFDGSGQCYLTANRAGNSDVDGGPTRLISPVFDLSDATNPVFRYARSWANDDFDSDPFDVEVSNDGGLTWTRIERVVNTSGGWVKREAYLTDYITLTAQMKVRFSAMDNPNNSIDEGGVDAVRIFDIHCQD